MRFMLVAVNICHRSGDSIHPDYLSRIGVDLCFDELTRNYLNYTTNLRKLYLCQLQEPCFLKICLDIGAPLYGPLLQLTPLSLFYLVHATLISLKWTLLLYLFSLQFTWIILVAIISTSVFTQFEWAT